MKRSKTGISDFEGIIAPGGSWGGFRWPIISGLNYDPDLIFSLDMGQI